MPFLNYQGKLAYTAGWFTEQAQPQRTRHVLVSNVNVADYEWLLEITARQVDWTDDYGVIHRPGYKPVTVDISDWKSVTEHEPIAKPRRGKRQGMAYDWEWVRGDWVRKWE